MATKKVRVYKSPNGVGSYINKTANFLNKALPKAKYGMQQDYEISEVMNTILDELALDNTEDDVAYTLQEQYGMSYDDALDAIDTYREVLSADAEKADEATEFIPEDDNFGKRYDYALNQDWIASAEDSGWGDDLDTFEDTEDELKKGGSISKSKFVKTVVRGLKKANEGIEQQNTNSSTILDTPVNGRGDFLSNFRRGIKDLGNEYYAKKIYDQTNIGIPRAEQGMEMTDPENPMHHLQVYGDTTSNIFQKPMNQVHGAGFEVPQARRGREQRQQNRQQRQMNKDWNKMFGRFPAGNISLPGLPSYIGNISPQIIQSQPGINTGVSGPLMDVQFKKGPWWKGTREWSIKGMPTQSLIGSGMGMLPSYGYMPRGYGHNSSWSTHTTYPGEIIRRTVSGINAAADPGKNAEADKLKNNPNKPAPTIGSYGPGYEGFNADANGNGVPDYLEGAGIPIVKPTASPERLSEIEREYGDIKNESTMFSTPEEYDQFMSTNPTNEEIDAYLEKKLSDPNSAAAAYRKQTDLSNRESQDERIKRGIQEANAMREINTRNMYSNPMMMNTGYSPANIPVTDISSDENYENYQGGGFIDSSNPDLYKFIYGGMEPENISNVVYYDNNDIDTKNVEDPYYRHGGLHKAAPGWQVVDPEGKIKPQAPNQFQSPAFQQYAPGATATQNKSAFDEMKRRGIIPANSQYDNTKSYAGSMSGRTIDMRSGQNQGGYRVGDQVIYNQNRDYYGNMGMIPGGYNMMNRPRTIRQFVNMFNPIQNDGVWMSQNGPARTMNGQPYNSRIAQTATAGYTDASGNVVKPTAGYVQDYDIKKGPWWSGKTTISVKNRWDDPNAGNYLGPVNPNAKPMTNQPTQTPTQPGQTTTVNKPAGMTVTNATGNQIKGVNEKGELVSQQFESTRRRFRDRNSKQYGGDYDSLYEFQGLDNSQVNFNGTGPFDPNANNVGGIGQGKIGPCNEEEVVDPNSPCYDPSYRPQDFETDYTLEQARTFKPRNLSNAFKAIGAGIRNTSGTIDNLNADANLAANLTGDNRKPVNYSDYSGGPSGQTQRGAGATGFNSVVGNAAFVKEGGQIKYKEGGTYDLSQEEIGKILAAGGQIKFI